MRRLLRTLSTVLILSGILLMADAGLTVAWQEPVSALYARATQDRLGGDLQDLEQRQPTTLERRALHKLPAGRHRTAFLARSLKRRLKEGQAAGRVRIPALGVKYVVVDGTDPASLRKGPGFFGEQPYPGARGTVAIAGHRTTYSAPFRKVDQLHKGNRIIVEMPYGRFTYAVESKRIVKPTAMWVLDRKRHDRLVLSACHPLYSAAERIVIFARLVKTEQRGAALDA
jgi:sortase A